MASVEIPEYSPDLFVDRDEEIEEVMERAKALIDGEVSSRVIVFTGERGAGKTWLLRHLAEKELPTIPNLRVVYIDFQDETFAGKEHVQVVAEIIRQVSKATGGPERLGVDLAEMSQSLLAHLRDQVLERGALALLLDHVHESDWELLRLVEDYLLAPLAMEKRVLFVMTGRGRLYPWQTIELVPRTPDLRLLEPFDPDQIEEQIELLKRRFEIVAQKTEEIQRLSGGNPLTNYLIARYGKEGLSLALDGLLEPVAEEEREEVREYIKALCVLRSFDEERIKAMLAAYYGDESYREWSYAQARRVRQKLIKWGFATWNSKKRGFVLNEVVRRIAEEYMRTYEKGKWCRLQEEASKIYEEWMSRYKSMEDVWKREYNHHHQYVCNVSGSAPVLSAAA